ncbi:MAG: flavoprotein [Planctomycetota bacterium]
MDAGLSGKHIMLGVCGGIAAYKSAVLTSHLAQTGAEVTVLMTESATRFVTPLTFQALSARPVYVSPWQNIESHDPQHIRLARNADLAIVAPCTMNTLAKLVAGMCDDIVTLALSAIDRTATPVLLAPSMNTEMWNQASTQRNIAQLRHDGFTFVQPGTGWQACRTEGKGRMAEPDDIARAAKAAISIG